MPPAAQRIYCACVCSRVPMALLLLLVQTTVCSAACLFCMLLYHVVGIIASLLVSTLIQKQTESGREIESFARRGLIGRAIGLVVLTLVTVARLLMHIVQTFFTVLYTMLPLIAICTLLALVQFRWAGTLRAIDVILTGNMPLIRTFILAPFAIAAEGALFLAPLYNLVVYSIVHVPINVLLWVLSGMNAVQFASSLLSLLMSIREAAGAFTAFLMANPSNCAPFLAAAMSNCSSVTTNGGSMCTGPTSPPLIAAAYSCLDTGRRALLLAPTCALVSSGLQV